MSLLARLRAYAPDADARTLAEAVWLAARVPPVVTERAPEEAPPQHAPSSRTTPAPVLPPSPAPQESASIHGSEGASRGSGPAGKVAEGTVARPPQSYRPLKWARALHRLGATSPDGAAELDLARTVDDTARAGALVLRWRRRAEPARALLVLEDTAPQLAPWQDDVARTVRVATETGRFRRVTHVRVDLRGDATVDAVRQLRLSAVADLQVLVVTDGLASGVAGATLPALLQALPVRARVVWAHPWGLARQEVPWLRHAARGEPGEWGSPSRRQGEVASQDGRRRPTIPAIALVDQLVNFLADQLGEARAAELGIRFALLRHLRGDPVDVGGEPLAYGERFALKGLVRLTRRRVTPELRGLIEGKAVGTGAPWWEPLVPVVGDLDVDALASLWAAIVPPPTTGFGFGGRGRERELLAELGRNPAGLLNHLGWWRPEHREVISAGARRMSVEVTAPMSEVDVAILATKEPGAPGLFMEKALHALERSVVRVEYGQREVVDQRAIENAIRRAHRVLFCGGDQGRLESLLAREPAGSVKRLRDGLVGNGGIVGPTATGVSMVAGMIRFDSNALVAEEVFGTTWSALLWWLGARMPAIDRRDPLVVREIVAAREVETGSVGPQGEPAAWAEGATAQGELEAGLRHVDTALWVLRFAGSGRGHGLGPDLGATLDAPWLRVEAAKAIDTSDTVLVVDSGSYVLPSQSGAAYPGIAETRWTHAMLGVFRLPKPRSGSSVPKGQSNVTSTLLTGNPSEGLVRELLTHLPRTLPLVHTGPAPDPDLVKLMVEAGEARVLRLPHQLPELAAAIAERAREPDPGTIVHTALGILPLAYTPPGTFWMGSPDGVGDPREHPRHRVTLTRGLLVGVTPITQAQWRKVAGSAAGKRAGLPRSPSGFKGPDRPVEQVSWFDAARWCNVLSELEGRPAAYTFGPDEAITVELSAGYRLPTEAEWERFARVGTTTRWSFGDEEAQLSELAWFRENAGRTTHPVGTRRPNPWGLHDVYGNVWEWCSNQWMRDYTNRPEQDPFLPPAPGGRRVIRGGSWINAALRCRSGYRGGDHPDGRNGSLGFRVVLPLLRGA